MSAAMVSSRLFPPGTVYASALTPLVVAAVSEVLNRPADRVSELRRQRRTMVMQAQHQRISGGESTPLAGAPTFAQGYAAEEEFATNGGGGFGEIRIHGRTPLARRVLHPRVWITTAFIAFVIAVGVLTLPELIFGGAVASNHGTTFFGGGGSSTHTGTTETTPTTTTPSTQTTPTVTQTVPAQTPSTTQTQTTPTTTDTGTQTAPSGGAPAPTDTGTATTPTTTTP
jgi:hypothetical protein